MSYDSWKLRSDLDDSCNQFAEQEFEDLESTAAMLGVTVDEYLANKSRDRWLLSHHDEEIDELPF